MVHHLSTPNHNSMYYYLDTNQKPTGPFTHEELRSLLQKGAIFPDTLIAQKGADTWQKYSEVFPDEAACSDDLPPRPDAMKKTTHPAGHCPKCGAEILTERDELPLRCPTCQFPLRPESSTNVASCLRHSFVQYVGIRGRARRAEFLWFVLFYMVTLGVMLQCLPSLYDLASLLLFIPSITLSVRRMHDTGRSGWCIAAPLLLQIVGAGICFAGGISTIIHVIRNMDQPDLPINAIISPLLIAGLIVCGVAILAELYYFIIAMFWDSQRGPNKYGPSPKYPLAKPDV